MTMAEYPSNASQSAGELGSTGVQRVHAKLIFGDSGGMTFKTDRPELAETVRELGTSAEVRVVDAASLNSSEQLSAAEEGRAEPELGLPS